MKKGNGKVFNVYHRSELTGRLCRHLYSPMDWETCQSIRDHWNRNNPFHTKGGAWIDYHDLHLEPVVLDVGAVSSPLPTVPASYSIG